MRLAIMQPYFFPYLGYYQLVNAADRFVFLDNLSFIKKGWIHRNNLLNANGRQLISVPLRKVSQNKLIFNTRLHPTEYPRWRLKTLKSLQQTYGKAPFFEPTYQLARQVLNGRHTTIADLAMASVLQVARYLAMETRFTRASELEDLSDLSAQERIITICHQMKARQYINPIGGTALYSEPDFERAQLALRFLKMDELSYPQFSNPFVSHLSILDVLMFNCPEKIQTLLQAYHLKRDTKQLV